MNILFHIFKIFRVQAQFKQFFLWKVGNFWMLNQTSLSFIIEWTM